jgi:Mg2+ and Co2+ transporter CorA
LTDSLKTIEERVDRSFHALMASMSIAESERAIVQGTAVARLTELAFIFIPLNFACSFFSMQITVSSHFYLFVNVELTIF